MGSTSLTTDASGNKISESRYRPYGEIRFGTTGPTDFGFTSQRNEAGFGLMDYNARYYLPGLGRFISADTLVPEPGNPQNFNRYSYAYNNPIKYTDPTGHEGEPWEWAVRTFRNWACGGWNSISACPVDAIIQATGILPTELPDAGEMMGPLLVDGQEAETLGQVSGAIEWGASLAPLVSQFGEVWGPNVNVGRNEGVPYTGEDLQVSTGERFKEVIYGQHGDGATKYLWTVDKEGIKLAPEMTPFDTDRGNIVHTNLSPDGAFAGGELWFRSDNEIIINAGSGRYGYPRTGTPQNQAEAVQRYAIAVKMFQELGYTVDVIPPEDR